MADPSPRMRAARHDRPRATPRAPGADVPPATTAGAPGQHRLSAVPSARTTTGPAPGTKRRRVMTDPPSRHPVRQSMTVRAPPLGRRAMTYPSSSRRGRRVMAVRAPRVMVPDRQRSHHAPMARPGHALASAGTSVPITTAPLPARVSRLLQERLSRITATPDNRTYPQSHRLNRHSRLRGNPCPPVATGGPQGGDAPATRATCSQAPTDPHSHSTTHPVHPLTTAPTAARRSPPTAAGVHPATQAPTRPSPTTGTGVSRQTHPRAPPPRHCGAGRNPRPPAQRRDHRLTRVGFCVGAQHVAPNRPSFPRARESKREPPTL